jgi:acetate---CoA ligase (ADP-forming)
LQHQESFDVTTSPLRAFLKPQTLAVIGASRDPSKRGNRAIRTLQTSNFAGRIIPINPKEKEILSLPCYPDLAAVPFDIDLALVCTAARVVPEVVESCGKKGVKGAMLLAGGFSEVSEEGKVLEARTLEIARRYGVRLVGPNTNGMFDGHTGCNLVGWPGVYKGGLGVLSQSGNVAMSLLSDSIKNRHAGFTVFIGVGNECDVRFDEYLLFYGDDTETRALMVYVEGFKDGRAFLDAAREVTRLKPVVLYKAGRTRQGEHAARSHSGSLAGDYAVAKGALRQAGVTVVERSDELFPAADLLSRMAGKPAKRVAILSEGGGPISQAADALAERGLALPRLDAATEAQLKAIVPNASQLYNPVDCGGGTDPRAEYIAACSRVILADPNVDALLVVGYFGGYQVRYGESAAAEENEAARAVAGMIKEFGKPIVVQCHYATFETDAIDILRAADVAVLRSIEISAGSLAAVQQYHEWSSRSADPAATAVEPSRAAREIVAGAAGRGSLLETEARALLAEHGVRMPPSALVRGPREVARLDPRLKTGPVALKIVSRDILHKWDAGGVMLDVSGEAAITEGVSALIAEVRRRHPAATIDGVLVARMAQRGVEIILGVTRDAQYGPVLLFGLGGIFVEVMKDVAFRTLPLTRDDAAELLAEIKGRTMLDGVRGMPPVGRKALVDLMLRLSTLALTHPEIAEIDLNPVIARADGYEIVDARMILA